MALLSDSKIRQSPMMSTQMPHIFLSIAAVAGAAVEPAVSGGLGVAGSSTLRTVIELNRKITHLQKKIKQLQRIIRRNRRFLQKEKADNTALRDKVHVATTFTRVTRRRRRKKKERWLVLDVVVFRL